MTVQYTKKQLKALLKAATDSVQKEEISRMLRELQAIEAKA